jgi:hypothetical protein
VIDLVQTIAILFLAAAQIELGLVVRDLVRDRRR